MPRRKYIPSQNLPYHISARCLNKEWFKIPLTEVWNIFSDQLYFAHHAYNLRIHNFVLMSNHYHLLASTPSANLKETMNYFMRETSRRISYASGRINQIYGGPYYWSLINSNHYFLHAYKYVYRNPVEAALCSQVEHYPYSTLHGLLGFSKITIPTEEDTVLFNDWQEINHCLGWLNNGYKKDHKIQLRKALSKACFSFSLNRSNKKPSALETELS